MISEFRHVPSVSVPDTTYFVVSLKNGAPGSSSTVRVDHAGSNISYVVRPSRMPRDRFVSAPIVSPISGSKPYSNVHVGASITPSRLMNSCTCTPPTARLLGPLFGFETGGSQTLLPRVEEAVPDHEALLERDQLGELLLPLDAARPGLPAEAAQGQHPI